MPYPLRTKESVPRKTSMKTWSRDQADRRLVDRRGRERARPAQRRRLVGTVPVRAREREVAAEGVHRLPVEERPAERDRVLRVGHEVQAQRVLARAPRVGAGADPVVGAALEARRRQRVHVEQSEPVRAEAVRRDDVAGEGLSGERVADQHLAAEERVRGAEQLAEVAAPHGRGGHGAGVRLLAVVADPLLGPEEEQLVAVRVELSGDVERPADVVAVLVVVERSGLAVQLRQRRAVARPGVGVQALVAEELVHVGVEVAAAALGHEADLAAGGPSVFGHVARGQDLDLGDGVHVDGADERARGAGPGGDGAVDGDQVLVAAAAVDVEPAVAEAVRLEAVEAAARCRRARPA